MGKTHQRFLEANPGLTPEICQKQYFDFLLNIFGNKNIKSAIVEVFQKYQDAVNLPKRSFTNLNPKPIVDFIRTAASKTTADVVASPVLYTSAGSAAAAHTAPPTPTPTMLVAVNKSTSDPTSGADKKKAHDVSRLT